MHLHHRVIRLDVSSARGIDLMAVFRSQLHQDIWIEHHCARCYFGQGDTLCPILHRAVTGSRRKPVEWERNTRNNVTMAETIKCHSENRQPPQITRPVVDIDVPMFDVESGQTVMDSDHQ